MPLKLVAFGKTVLQPTLSSDPQGISLLTTFFLSSSEEVLPVGIIAGATIGAGILLTFFFITLVFFLYRRRKGSEYGLHGPQPSLTVYRAPSRQGLRGARGVAVARPSQGRSRNNPLQRLAESIQTSSPCPRSQGCDPKETGHQGGNSEP